MSADDVRTKFVEHFEGRGTAYDETVRVTVQVCGVDDETDDDFIIRAAPRIGHMSANFGLDRDTTIALRDSLTRALEATSATDIDVTQQPKTAVPA